jgi:7,8-dihydropterin-6-yl-methyl-4-(beta-D-ribofuranosyl)aminobenzene 5'-phosphate synthase
MKNLEPIDRVEIQVLIDNATDSLSTTPDYTESEFAYLARHGMKELDGDALCYACHGLSLLISGFRGATRHTILFDSGPEAYAFERNTERLGIDLGEIEAIVLSHGHWDHAGGMLKALDLIRKRNGSRAVPYYAHPGMFRSRARQRPNGEMMPMKDVPDVDALKAHGAEVRCLTNSEVFCDGMFFLSGEIPRVTSFERGLPRHFQKDENGLWQPDPLLIDERFLMVNVRDKGLLVFTACSHAGVVNALKHARTCVPDQPIHMVMGGFHLAGPNEEIIPSTVNAMAEFNLQSIAAAHCTGWRAMVALANKFGSGVINPSAVGKRYII